MTGVFRLGQDAETRYIPSGEPVANLSLAYSWGKKDQSTGFRKSQWIDAGLWGDRAVSLAPHLLKGAVLFVVLEDVHIETFRARDGTEKPKLAARVSSIEFVGPKNRDDDQQPARQQAPQPASRPAAPAARAAGGSGFDDMSDDIPF